MTSAYQLAFYQQGLPEKLLAVARYTIYEDDGRVLSVETIEYGNNPAESQVFQGQVITSLECGIDVLVLTPKDIKHFPLLHEMVG